MIRAFQPESQCAALGDWRYADLANVLGGDGYRVRTRAQLKWALDTAFTTGGRFQLIEVMLPAGDCTPTLARIARRRWRVFPKASAPCVRVRT